jgi:hypothetical protein
METTLGRQEAAAFPWRRIRQVLRPRPALVWLVGWGVLLAAQVISPLWYPTYDSARYLSIARSAATAGRLTNLGSTHLVYGVGYPLLVSPVFQTGPFPFLLLSAVHAGLAALYLAGTYVWARRHVPEGAVPAALLAVANAVVLVTLRRALSEAAFLPVMIWAVNALSAVPRSRRPWRPLAAAALLLSLLAVIRQAGILFVAGFGVQLAAAAWRRELSWGRACLLTLAVGLPATAALGAMLAYDREMAARQGSWSHLDVFTRSGAAEHAGQSGQSLPAQCLEGLRLRVGEVGRLTVPGMFNAYGDSRQWLNVNMLVYLPVCGLLVVGWWRFVRRLDVFALTLPFYAGLYVYWPFDQSGRFFAPLLPLLLVCLWHALAGLGRRRLALLTVLLVLHTAVAAGYWLAVDRPRALAEARRWPDLRQLAKVIRAEPGPVQAGPGLGKTHFLLEYLLDRPVAWRESGQPAAADARWLVTAAGEPAVAGFRTRALVGPYRLLRRQ